MGDNHHSRVPTVLAACVPALVYLLLFAQPAKAYTDPGTGAFLWQMLLGAGFVTLFYIRKIGRWLTRKKDRS